MARIALFFVASGSEAILERREKNLTVRFGWSKRYAYKGEKIEELRVQGPVRAITEIRFTEDEIYELEDISRSSSWFSSNMGVAEAVTLRIENEMRQKQVPRDLEGMEVLEICRVD